jgi:protein gp37
VTGSHQESIASAACTRLLSGGGGCVRRARIQWQISATVKFIIYEPALGPLHTLDLKGIDWVMFAASRGRDSGPRIRSGPATCATVARGRA